ncbi:MAG: hypothetical protein AB1813_18965 [Verrucomicrobiota bacterium]
MELAKAVSRWRFATAVQKAGAAERLVVLSSAPLWSALAERSGDSALAAPTCDGLVGVYEMAKAVSRWRFATAVQKKLCGGVFGGAVERVIWSALAERSGDSALAAPACDGLCDAYGIGQSGVALALCHRSPKEAVQQFDWWRCRARLYGVRWQNEVATAL